MAKLNKIFITGGAGYVGSRLVPFFLKNNYEVCVYDTMYFGSDHLGKHQNLRIIEGDIRDTKKIANCCKYVYISKLLSRFIRQILVDILQRPFSNPVSRSDNPNTQQIYERYKDFTD